MSKRNNYIIVGIIFLLAFFLGNLIYPQFLKLPNFPDNPFKLGLDLQGGTHLIYQADLSNIEQEERSSAMAGLRDVIERRVNLFGVQEPIVQIQDERLIVELAGIKDPGTAIKMIGQTPYLEFKEQKSEEEQQKILDKREEIQVKAKELQEQGKTQEEISAELDKIENWQLGMEDLFQQTSLTGKYLKKAEVGFDQTTYKPLVLLQFDDEGSKIFEDLTTKNVGKPLAIYIDGISISSPVVQEAISGGKAQISGKFTIDEAKDLARNLNAGALPVPIELISQQTVGPTLGKISLEKSLRAGIFGFLAIILFMIIFYRMLGVLASLALLIYAIIVLSLFKTIPVTLTLAGIGGAILSIGMAIDANVLIFSRMKEELMAGKSFDMSVEEGFSRAWPSIRDGNLTTLLVAVILFVFGSSFIKGFAFTLSLGILISMFSAIFITKNFLRVFIGTKLEKVKWLWR